MRTATLWETRISRRAVLAAFGSVVAVPGIGVAEDAAVVDTRVRLALATLFGSRPRARALASRAAALLVMPDVLEGGFLVAGAYGEGALLEPDPDGTFRTSGYYSVASASLGLQIGVQSTGQVLFFMTGDALEDFRASDGWEIGADAAVTVINQGATADVTSTSVQSPIVAMVFTRQGALVGARLEGSKYSRLSK